MNKYITFLTAIVILAASFSSCRTTKTASGNTAQETSNIEIETAPAEKYLYTASTVAETLPQWTDFSASGNITIRTGSSLKSAMLLRMERGKYISISLRPILGIEVGKLYIDNDSVTVVDKYHNLYLKEAISDFIGQDISLEALQCLLLARPFLADKGQLTDRNAKSFKATPTADDGSWRLSPAKQPDRLSYEFLMSGNLLTAIEATGAAASVRYAGHNEGFASLVTADMAIGGTKAVIELNLNKSIRWNSGVTDKVSIPRNARRYSFAEIIKAFSSQQ